MIDIENSKPGSYFNYIRKANKIWLLTGSDKITEENIKPWLMNTIGKLDI